ncbi:methyl-accepting chemotaxis protein [Methanosarcina mazei]|uniref:Chemotaxis protein n=4 Tax=Methanosarcina mazei TaxID=2209 RepID=A0A0F8JM42_METMZ|nr:PAS domain-containing methyl-accepting chemotaxis protein [Methanosarcina mazei]AKB41922.1 Methyl-accepting chemotaxis protein [Methanosarcina mazei WWM610]AKB66207.1 Methyl-accepting chemotaxis protein [Methanosarcina mazei S-6]AKB68672.1 Methyl-accepting chemotaxis protein [Methanosarcina mazei LYC]KKG76778.1 chemotaxis protein [Methanosarcina mazei]KKH60015.1 chemotaxis protein [Methanosarcina mazei]
MALQNSDLKLNESADSSNKFTEDADTETIETGWLIDNLPVTVFRVSNESSWPICYISKSVEVLTGYPAAEFLSRRLSWSDIVFPEDVSRIDAAIENSMKTRSPYQVEYRIQKSCGDTVFVQEQARLVNDEHGNIAYIDGVFLDVTPQIKRREESQRAIVSSIPRPSLALYVDASGKIKYINEYFLEICRFKSADEATGRSPSELLDTSSRRTLAEKVMETGEGIYNVEKSIKFKALDKPLFTVLSAVPVKDETGTIAGSLMVITDMTEMKDRETEVKEILNYTSSCLKNLGDGIRKISEGDLDIHLEKIKDDDFGDTFDEFNRLVNNLKSVIENVLEDMLTTLEEARQSEEAVNQMNMGMQQISTAAEQIATGSENLSRHAGTAASDIKASQEIFKKLSESSTQSSSYASHAGKTSDEAQGLSNTALEEVEQLVAGISQLGDIVHSLDDAVNNIGAVTGKIKSIADQTNLLALNAAIEAARAGEYGRGFAVVADEVRKLAADSRKSTDEINEIVTNVQKETRKVTDAINTADSQAKNGSKNIKQALNKSHEIVDAVATINSMLAELDRLAEEGLIKIENIEKSISETASTAEENAASSEETSAAIEEQTAAMQQVSTSVQNVSGLARRTVDTLFENFKVSGEQKKSQPSFDKTHTFNEKRNPKLY